MNRTRRGAYPWIRLAILDVTILINLGTRAFKTAGVLRALPIILTALIFIMISVPSNLSRIVYPRKASISIQSWMVKYQFIIAYKQKKT
jgi:hypothetical protein